MGDWAPIFGPLGLIIGATVTGWFAIRERRVDQDRPDWPTFSERLERRVAAQDAKIDELFILVGKLRTELESEQRRSSVVLRYLRVVLAWAIPLVPAGSMPPHPPAEISDEISDWIGGGQ